MDKLHITGPVRLMGEVKISGAKNAALPAMAACILADGETTLNNVPRLQDVRIMQEILSELGLEAEHAADGSMVVKTHSQDAECAPYELVRTMRASISVLGPLLARRGRARVSLPGGCVIGPRPIDLHLKGLEALGAKIKLENGYVVAEAKKLRGARIYLGGSNGSTVLGTLTVMMAASLAEGTTIIEHAACEPEVEDVARLLISMGAKIKGEGTHRITIEGVNELSGTEHDVIPDRIEAATFLIAGAATQGNVLCLGAKHEHLDAVIALLQDSGAELILEESGIRVKGVARPKGVDVGTLAYPGFPTDVQAQMTALLAIAGGKSSVVDRVFPDRFTHCGELNRMGASIIREGAAIAIPGVEKLGPAEVTASDLRASAALVIAALLAEGETVIHRIYHLDRGYELLEEKLSALGASVRRES